MSEKVDLTDVESEDLVKELSERGDLPPSELDDFSDQELLDHLGIEANEIDWNLFYSMFATGRQEEAISEFKRHIEEKTGRIIV